MKIGDTVIPNKTETIINDDFPVNWDYFYVVDNRVFRSDVKGNVLTLKRDLLNQGFIKSLDVECRRFDMNRIF